MKKGLPAIFASVFVAAALIGTLAGCDYEIELTSGPWPSSVPPVTTLPKTVPPVESLPPITSQTVPGVTSPGVITEPIVTPFANFDPSLCTANADERAAKRNWVCLNEYVELSLEYQVYDCLFDTETAADYGMDDVYIKYGIPFNHPATIYAIEMTFENEKFAPNAKLELGMMKLNMYDLVGYCEGVEKTEDGAVSVPGRTLWFEPMMEEELYDSLIGFSSNSYKYPNGLTRIRLFGTVEPIIEEIRAPSYVPENVIITDSFNATRYARTYSGGHASFVAGFYQYTIYGSQPLPSGSVELMQFAGRNVVKVQYEQDPDYLDFYWDDGEYRYRLCGYDEELLLRLAESIEPMQ